jgi:hypothetical protein
MLKTYQRHLYRDRRRLALGTLLLLGSGAMANATLPALVPGLRTEILATLPLLIAIPLITIYQPKHRHWIEIAMLATFLHLALGHLLPGSVYDHRGPWGYTPVAFLAYFVTIAVTAQVLYGHWSDRFAPPYPVIAQAHACSALDSRHLWYGLVPTPGHGDKNPDPKVVSIEYADATRRSVRLITWEPGQPPGEVLLHIDAITPFARVRLRMDVVSGRKDRGGDGVTEFTLEDQGRRRALTLTHRLDRPLPRQILCGWLDDTLGRMMDTRLDAIEAAAAGHGPAKTRQPLGHWVDQPGTVVDGRPDTLGGYRTAYGRRASDRERAAIDEIRAA